MDLRMGDTMSESDERDNGSVIDWMSKTTDDEFIKFVAMGMEAGAVWVGRFGQFNLTKLQGMERLGNLDIRHHRDPASALSKHLLVVMGCPHDDRAVQAFRDDMFPGRAAYYPPPYLYGFCAAGLYMLVAIRKQIGIDVKNARKKTPPSPLTIALILMWKNAWPGKRNKRNQSPVLKMMWEKDLKDALKSIL